MPAAWSLALTEAQDNPKRQAACLCHGISFVEDEQLEWRAGVPGHRLTHRGGSKRLDLLPHHIDASLITGIELLHPRLCQLRPMSISMASTCQVNHASHTMSINIIQSYKASLQVPYLGSPIQLPGQSQSCGGLASSRRSIEEQVWQLHNTRS